MSVTSLVDGTYIDLGLTFSDHTSLLRWLAARPRPERFDVLGMLLFQNVDVSRTEALAALAEAEALPNQPAKVTACLARLRRSLEPVPVADDANQGPYIPPGEPWEEA